MIDSSTNSQNKGNEGLRTSSLLILSRHCVGLLGRHLVVSPSTTRESGPQTVDFTPEGGRVIHEGDRARHSVGTDFVGSARTRQLQLARSGREGSCEPPRATE